MGPSVRWDDGRDWPDRMRLFEKTGVQDNIALARLAAQWGLMDPTRSL